MNSVLMVGHNLEVVSVVETRLRKIVVTELMHSVHIQMRHAASSVCVASLTHLGQGQSKLEVQGMGHATIRIIVIPTIAL